MKPALQGADGLCIVSGYATPAMAFHHLEKVGGAGKKIAIDLVVGMPAADGISRTNHKGFQVLSDNEYFQASYIYRPPAVHSKVYVWTAEGKPVLAFAGSANYTQTAFGKQRETLVECDPEISHKYYSEISAESIYCNHGDAEQLVQVYNEKLILKRAAKAAATTPEEEEVLQTASGIDDLMSLPRMCVSFLANDGTLPQGSGLNWGQRDGREPNQAYIRLPSSVYNTDFFPPVATHFTVLTDDNKVLICTRAQSNGKAIHTPHNNSEIGIYFRHRLDVDLGKAVLNKHLEKYGRHEVCFYKIDDETYFMDFNNAS